MTTRTGGDALDEAQDNTTVAASPKSCSDAEADQSKQLLLETAREWAGERFNERLKDAAPSSDTDLAFLLGCGISRSFDMPLWNGLVNRMIGAANLSRVLTDITDMSTEQKAEIAVTEAMLAGTLELLPHTNPLEGAEYIRNSFLGDDLCTPHEELPIDSMLMAIIGDIMLGTRPVSNPLELEHSDSKHQLAELSQQEKDALCSMYAVAHLMHAGIVTEAVNYNFDPFLQQTLMEVYGEPAHRIQTLHDANWRHSQHTYPAKRDRSRPVATDCEHVMDSSDDTAEDSDIEPLIIHHVHGFVRPLQGAEEKTSALSVNSRNLVLTEHSYRGAERSEQYNWSSLTQASYLQRRTCIAVGFSAEDQNFRRIVSHLGHRTIGERSTSYIVVTCDDVIEHVVGSVGKVFASETTDQQRIKVRAALDIYAKQKEKYWQTYGFNIMWTDVKSLPGRLIELCTKLDDGKSFKTRRGRQAY